MKPRNPKSRKTVAAAFAIFVLGASGCTSTGIATTTPSSSGGVQLDQLATISVNPVDYGGQRVVTAIFSEIEQGRPVTLQRQDGSDWDDLDSSKQDEYGQATFVTRSGGSEIYRAVAAEMAIDGERTPAVATPAAAFGSGWDPKLTAGFDGTQLAKPWSNRNSGNYKGNGHHCAAPYPSNVEISGGEARLSVTEETSSANIAMAKAAGCEEDAVYRDAAISTEAKLTLKTGVVAARVKFPVSQGMHGSVWLQSYSKSELDMIESYGYGRGLTSVIHVDGERYPAENKDTYVLSEAVKDLDWWSDYHVYSVEWDNATVVFRVDGVETRRLDRPTPEAEYFVVISMGTSDWEQKRFEKPVQNADNVQPGSTPQTMAVDWVKAWERA